MLNFQSSYSNNYRNTSGSSSLENVICEKDPRVFEPLTQSAVTDSYSPLIHDILVKILSFHDFSKRNEEFQNLTSFAFTNELRRELRNVLDTEILEAGMIHPGEAMLENALTSNSTSAMRAIEAFICDENTPGFAQNTLWLLANVPLSSPDLNTWKATLIKRALASPSNGLREAAIRAVENWEGEVLVNILKSHTESVPWIREYCEDVIDDLSE